MVYLRYYAKENERHFHAEHSKLTAQQMLEATEFLCNEFGLPQVHVGWTHVVDRQARRKKTRKVKSWFDANELFMGPDGRFSRRRSIVYHPSMMTALTVAHEFAHYWDFRRLAEEMAVWMDGDRKQPRPSRHHHGPEHARLVDKAVAALKKAGYMPPMPEPQKAVEDPVKAAFDALPDMLCCPKCGQTRAKDHFGVRVVRKNADGEPVSVQRQSYCTDCRSRGVDIPE